MNLKIDEVKSEQSFKTFLIEVEKSSKKRTFDDMLVEVLDGEVFITPESKETDCDANNYGNYRKYKFSITEKLGVSEVQKVCQRLGIRYDNYDLV